jgi:dTDP-4-amino-4,6-dideoxygalactose transaminase
MTVHMAGLIAPDTDDLIRLCQENGLFYAEDAAHAHGATIDGCYAGALGSFGAFSFYPTKVITTGEGGMLTTNDDELAALARSFRNHGARSETPEYERVSTNWRLPEISAALGLVQIRHLDEFVTKRNHIAARYNAALRQVSGIKLLPTYDHIRHSYWNYILLLEPGINRTVLAQMLSQQYGVPVAWPYDPPCHLQPVFMKELGTGIGHLPVSEEVLSRHLALPMHVLLSDEEVDYIIDSLIKAL